MTARCHCDNALSQGQRQRVVTMPTLTDGDRVQVTLLGQLLGQRFMNTFLYRAEILGPAVDMVNAFGKLFLELNDATGLIASWQDVLPDNAMNLTCWIQTIRPVRGRRLIYSIAGSGEWEGSANVSNLQASITRQGPGTGPREQGGIRIPISEGAEAVAGGYVTVLMENKLQVLADVMKENVPIATPDVVFVPQVGLPAGALASFDLFDTTIQTTVRVLRRRTVGRGE